MVKVKKTPHVRMSGSESDSRARSSHKNRSLNKWKEQEQMKPALELYLKQKKDLEEGKHEVNQ
jgi:hypothetical protein